MSQIAAVEDLRPAQQDASISHLHDAGPDGEIEDLVAANLMRLRALRNLSLDALSRMAGVSRAMLAQIESGRSVTSIRVLHRIASALEVSVSAFLRDFALHGIELLPAQASRSLVSADGRFSSRSLFPTQRQQRFEFHEIRLDPFAVEQIAPQSPGTYKNLVVAEGVLEVCAHGQTQLLGRGDAVFFDADHQHHYRNPSDTAGLAYIVTYRPE